MISLRVRLLTLALLLVLSHGKLHAVFVVLKSGEQIYGFLVEQSESRVSIREATAEGKGLLRHISRDQIETLRIPAKPERLEALSRDNPKEYRNFAEELAVPAKRDPEARDIALRLYLIAAYLDRSDLGKSSLLGMISLARNPAEEKSFRALAYLLDPEHDPRVLKREQTASVQPETGVDPVTLGKFANALRALRRGQLSTARNFSSDPRVRKLFDKYNEVLPYSTFLDAARSGKVPAALLQRIVTIELELRDDGDESSESVQVEETADWARIIRKGERQPIPSLKLETVTEFDPRKCHFRDGRWVKP